MLGFVLFWAILCYFNYLIDLNLSTEHPNCHEQKGSFLFFSLEQGEIHLSPQLTRILPSFDFLINLKSRPRAEKDSLWITDHI